MKNFISVCLSSAIASGWPIILEENVTQMKESTLSSACSEICNEWDNRCKEECGEEAELLGSRNAIRSIGQISEYV